MRRALDHGAVCRPPAAARSPGFGIVAASLNALGRLFFIRAYPLWSLAMFAADVVIAYALATYAGPRLRDL